MIGDQADEDQLLARAGEGDREAFDALVAATAPSVWTVVRRLTASESQAEDALQETYVAAWRGASSWRGEGGARAWLYSLARRKAARTWRLRAGEPRSTEPVEALDQLAVAAGWGANPEAVAARAEGRDALFRALGTLSDGDREILTLCDLEENTPTEAAESLGIAPGTARVRLHRARLRLMGALNQEVS